MTPAPQDEKTTTNSEAKDAASQAPCSKPGELLRQAREAQGLTQEDIAKRLNFLPPYVPALEEENFQVLPSKTFIKGYMRAYARFLEIDAEEVLQCLAAHHPELDNQQSVRPLEGVRPEKKGRRLLFRLFTLLIIIALVAVIIFWWQSRNLESLPLLSGQDVQVETLEGNTISAPMQQARNNSEQQLTPSEQQLTPEESTEVTEQQGPASEAEATAGNEAANSPETAAEAQAQLPNQVQSPNQASSQQTSSQQTSSQQTSSQQTPDPAPDQPAREEQTAAQEPEQPPATEPQTPANTTRLVLDFSGDCWTEVRDAQGQMLHANLNKEGDRVELEGVPPYSLVLGQGQVVSISHQGEAFDFSSRVRGNGYAAFTIE